jgi:hypothetical protein
VPTVPNVISLQVQDSGYCQSRGQNALGVGNEKVGPSWPAATSGGRYDSITISSHDKDCPLPPLFTSPLSSIPFQSTSAVKMCGIFACYRYATPAARPQLPLRMLDWLNTKCLRLFWHTTNFPTGTPMCKSSSRLP